MNSKIIEGKLFFYSETGTEGGYWALQDRNYISLASPIWGTTDGKVFDIENHSKTGVVSYAEVFLNNEWLPLPDPIYEDADYHKSSLWHGEEQGDLSADKRLMEKYGFKIKYAAQRLDEKYGKNNWKMERGLSVIKLKDGSILHIGVTPTTEPNRPYGVPQNGLTRATIQWNDGTIDYQRKSDTLLVESWSYEGLHILRNGDKVKIFDPINNSSVWEGIIDLKPYAVFSQWIENGGYIHADQKGISRKEWAKFFFADFYAQLEISGNL